MEQPKITVEFDSQIATPRNANADGEKTPFLRFTIVGVPAELGDAGKALIGARGQVWANTDPKIVTSMRGKIAEIVGSVTDKFAVERGDGDTGRTVFRFVNITVLREYDEAEAAKARGAIMMAQLQGLATAPTRVVSLSTASLDAAAQVPVPGDAPTPAPSPVPGLAAGGQL